MEKANEQIKSRQRVTDHGEVFTAEREVNAMLDLVKQETERIDSRFLEPACGTGNFLEEILRRKLNVVKSRYSKSKSDYERYSIVAVTSIYGVDILEDNILECRNRMYSILEKQYKKLWKEDMGKEYSEAVKYILTKNILHGDALSMKTLDKNPIIFSEWTLVSGNMIKRRDYRFDELLEGNQDQRSVFTMEWEYDEEIQAFIPAPIKEYPLVDYRRVQYAE
ncbi:MAG: SAM-dependent DNA methyltransferase [Clostridiales bacterium]|nr:SAM-dependent DNA methyltransferase [Clostridiales bacterium]